MIKTTITSPHAPCMWSWQPWWSSELATLLSWKLKTKSNVTTGAIPTSLLRTETLLAETTVKVHCMSLQITFILISSALTCSLGSFAASSLISSGSSALIRRPRLRMTSLKRSIRFRQEPNWRKKGNWKQTSIQFCLPFQPLAILWARLSCS